MSMIDPEAQALAYRMRWRQRLLAHAARVRSLRGQPTAWRQNLLNWRPLLVQQFDIPVGDEDDEQEYGASVNG